MDREGLSMGEERLIGREDARLVWLCCGAGGGGIGEIGVGVAGGHCRVSWEGVRGAGEPRDVGRVKGSIKRKLRKCGRRREK